MSNILISPLGAGLRKDDDTEREYVTANYRFEEEKSEYETSFVAAALARHLNIDKIFFIGTARSMWENVYDYFCKNSSCEFSEDYWLELAEKIDESSVDTSKITEADLFYVNSAIDNFLNSPKDNTGGSKCKIIEYGINNEEIWENFDTIMGLEENFSHGDKIYLDITHSFRSIPMFMYLLMDFVKTLKATDVQLAGVYYGMLEVKRELGYAPVVDLSPLFEISKWIRGVYDFTNYGNGYLISELIDDEDMSSKLERVSNLVNINLLENLSNQIRKLNNIMESASSEKVFKYIEPQIKSFLERFANLDTEWEFQLEISKWYAENNNYVNGYICLFEAIITYFCTIYDFDIKDYSNRKKVKDDLLERYASDKYSNEKAFRELGAKFKKIDDLRNNVAHGGTSAQEMRNPEFEIANLEQYQEETEKLLQKPEIENFPEKYPLS